MQIVEIAENPRRRRRKLSAKQIAAGFGGKRRRRPRRRRNPAMATYATAANPRRRRRSAVRSFRRRSRRRAYRNPGIFSGLGSMLDVNSLLWMSAGAVAVKLAPRYVQKVWAGMPTTGLTGKLIQAGLGFGLSLAVRQFVGRKQAQDVLNGALVVTMVEILNENVLPMIGLSDYVYLSPAEMAPLGSGLSDYVYDTSVVPGQSAMGYMS